MTRFATQAPDVPSVAKCGRVHLLAVRATKAPVAMRKRGTRLEALLPPPPWMDGGISGRHFVGSPAPAHLRDAG